MSERYIKMTDLLSNTPSELTQPELTVMTHEQASVLDRVRHAAVAVGHLVGNALVPFGLSAHSVEEATSARRNHAYVSSHDIPDEWVSLHRS